MRGPLRLPTPNVPYTLEYANIGRKPYFTADPSHVQFFERLHRRGAMRTREAVRLLGERDLLHLLRAAYLVHHPTIIGGVIVLAYNGRAALGLRRDKLIKAGTAADHVYLYEGSAYLEDHLGYDPPHPGKRLQQVLDHHDRPRLLLGKITGGGYSAKTLRAHLKRQRHSAEPYVVVLHPNLQRTRRLMSYGTYGVYLEVVKFVPEFDAG